MDTNTSSYQTVDVLKQHVSSIVSSIQSIKHKNVELESQVKVLQSENKRLQEKINQDVSKNKTYEEKLKTLQKLLDEAQEEQSLLEQSILSAISNLSEASKEISGYTPPSPQSYSQDSYVGGEEREEPVSSHKLHESEALDNIDDIIVDDELEHSEGEQDEEDEQLEIF